LSILRDFQRVRQDTLTPVAAMEEGRAAEDGRGFVVVLNSPLPEPEAMSCRPVALSAPVSVAGESQGVYLGRLPAGEVGLGGGASG